MERGNNLSLEILNRMEKGKFNLPGIFRRMPCIRHPKCKFPDNSTADNKFDLHPDLLTSRNGTWNQSCEHFLPLFATWKLTISALFSMKIRNEKLELFF